MKSNHCFLNVHRQDINDQSGEWFPIYQNYVQSHTGLGGGDTRTPVSVAYRAISDTDPTNGAQCTLIGRRTRGLLTRSRRRYQSHNLDFLCCRSVGFLVVASWYTSTHFALGSGGSRFESCL